MPNSFKFMGERVTITRIMEALKAFDAAYPNTKDYENWLESSISKYVLRNRHSSRYYPLIDILINIKNISIEDFIDEDDAIEGLRDLGFFIKENPIRKKRSRFSFPNSYLLIWNPSNFTWTSFYEDLEAIRHGFRPLLRWSCGNTKRIAAGDRVFLMRLGQREKIKGILASGVVVVEPYMDAHWSEANATALYLRFEADTLLDPATEKLLDPREISTQLDWYPQKSGVQIPAEIAQRLEIGWHKHLNLPELDSLSPSKNSSQTFVEGQRHLLISYRSERDAIARLRCIEHYGTECVVCGFDFGKKFGDIGDGFIHVHHLKPISEQPEAYEVDPIRDLRPICPNCHAMLHRRSPPYSIEELSEIISKY